jgi:subfamily B ATP-binding cassette protein MsbA
MLGFLLKVWGLAKPYRVRLYLGIITGVLSGLMQPLMIATVVFVYGAIFPSGAPKTETAQSSFGFTPKFIQHWSSLVREQIDNAQAHLKTHPTVLVLLLISIPLVMFLRGIFGYLNVYFLQWTASRTIADLRTKLFGHLMNLSAGFYNENTSGALISRMMNDTGSLQSVLSGATSVIVRDPVTLIGLAVFLLLSQPKLTLISIVVLPACILPIAIFSRKVRRASRDMQSQSAELTQIMSESFTGQRVIKAYNLEKMVTQQFYQTARKTVGNYMRMVRAVEIPGPLIEFFGACGIALVLAYVIFKSPTPPTGFITLIGSIFTMYGPIKNLTRLQNQLVQARAASERVFELLATANSVPEPAQPKTLIAAGADIVFDSVYFSYGEKLALENINLRVQSGQLVAFVGASGSGKTTLANLVLRFYDPSQGSVQVGGVDLRDVSTRDLRQNIAVVAQENVLFNETIRRNIELGRPGATEEEIVAAAKSANADEFILAKPEGYQTKIGEKGVTLSGGQRQRLAIARAVLRNASILILDEATSALDTESEREVQAELDKLMLGRTTICIAHRLSTILHADMIVVMDRGRIAETGTHTELMQRGGLYRKLYDLQFRE